MGVRAEFQVDLVQRVNEGLGKVRADEVGKSPPTSWFSESLPSENAPAPEKPVVMLQGWQFKHFCVLLSGRSAFPALAPFDHQNLLVCAAAEQLDGRKDAWQDRRQQ